MAKKSSISKNIKRTKISDLYFKKRNEIKEQIYNKSININERFLLVQKLDKLIKDSSKIRVRNRCATTGKPRGFLSKFSLCRNAFREYASIGLISGVRKSSW